MNPYIYNLDVLYLLFNTQISCLIFDTIEKLKIDKTKFLNYDCKNTF